jgi:hydroxyacylglutathione hydrolase
LVKSLSEQKEESLNRGRKTLSASRERLEAMKGGVMVMNRSMAEISAAVVSQSNDVRSINSSVKMILENIIKSEKSALSLNKNSLELYTEVENLSRLSSDLLTYSSGVKIVELSVEEANAYKTKYQLVDVRRPDEWEAADTGHVEGAMFITLDDQFEANLSKLPKNLPLMFVCRSGGRSARACRVAQRLGFTHVYNVKGGMLDWAKKDLPRVCQISKRWSDKRKSA